MLYYKGCDIEKNALSQRLLHYSGGSVIMTVIPISSGVSLTNNYQIIWVIFAICPKILKNTIST